MIELIDSSQSFNLRYDIGSYIIRTYSLSDNFIWTHTSARGQLSSLQTRSKLTFEL